MAIRITPDEMRGRANEFRNEAAKVSEVIAKMDGLLGALQGEWEGSASQSFASRFNELRPGFVKAEELSNELAAALDSTANTFQATDEGIRF